jgi:hypothetical protein
MIIISKRPGFASSFGDFCRELNKRFPGIDYSALGGEILFFLNATRRDFRLAKISSGRIQKISFAERSEAKEISTCAYLRDEKLF